MGLLTTQSPQSDGPSSHCGGWCLAHQATVLWAVREPGCPQGVFVKHPTVCWPLCQLLKEHG